MFLIIMPDSNHAVIYLAAPKEPIKRYFGSAVSKDGVLIKTKGYVIVS
jgi:hypothetical protein